MRTEQAIREFIASRIAQNLSKETIKWYQGRLYPFMRACPFSHRLGKKPVVGIVVTKETFSKTVENLKTYSFA